MTESTDSSASRRLSHSYRRNLKNYAKKSLVESVDPGLNHALLLAELDELGLGMQDLDNAHEPEPSAEQFTAWKRRISSGSNRNRTEQGFSRSPREAVPILSRLNKLERQALQAGSKSSSTRIGSRNRSRRLASDSSNVLTLSDMTLTGFGTKSEDGGALFLENYGTINILDVIFTGNKGNRGGAVYISNATVVYVSGSTFRSNKGVSGAALFLKNVDYVYIEDSAFEYNVADATGGAVVTEDCLRVVITGSTFEHNIAGYHGGALAINKARDEISLETSTYTNNTATYGSAVMLARSSNVSIADNSFRYNEHVEGASIFWLYLDSEDTSIVAMNAPVAFTGNDFYQNREGGVVEYKNITTEVIGTLSEPASLLISNYASNVRDLILNVSLIDYYQRTVKASSTLVTLSAADEDGSCSFNQDSYGIYGSLSAYTSLGSAAFSNFGARCTPGGNLILGITTTVEQRPVEFPLYAVLSSAAFLALAAEERDVTTKMNAFFRLCTVGEYFDYSGANKSACHICPRGSYSLVNNTDHSITSCLDCPTEADDCLGADIWLYEGTWRLNSWSDTIYDCPMPYGCKGGTDTGADLCRDGFEGILCGSCSDGYYVGAASDGYGSCLECASGRVLSGIQIFMILITIGMVYGIWYYRKHRKNLHKELLRIMPEVVLHEEEDEPSHGHETQRRAHLMHESFRRGTVAQELKKEAKEAGHDKGSHPMHRKPSRMKGEHGFLGLHRTFTEEFLIVLTTRFKICLVAYQLIIALPEALNLQMGTAFYAITRMFQFIDLDLTAFIPLGCGVRWQHTHKIVLTATAPIVVAVGAMLYFLYRRFRRRRAYFAMFPEYKPEIYKGAEADKHERELTKELGKKTMRSDQWTLDTGLKKEKPSNDSGPTITDTLVKVLTSPLNKKKGTAVAPLSLEALATPAGKKQLLHPRKTKDEVLTEQKEGLGDKHHEADLEEVMEVLNLSTLESMEQQRLARFLHTMLVVSYILFPGVALNLVRAFNCTTIDPDEVQTTGDKPTETSYLKADLSISCTSSAYWTGYYFSAVMCVLYLVALPALHAFLLFRCRDLIQQRVALATVLNVADGHTSPSKAAAAAAAATAAANKKEPASSEHGELDDDGKTINANDDDETLIDSRLHVTSRNIDLSHRLSVLLNRMEGKEGSHQRDMRAYVDAREKYMATHDTGHSVFAYDVSHFLFLSYKPQYWYWEAVESLRRLLLGAGLAVVYSGTSEQVLLGLLVAVIFFSLQCFLQPYISEEANNLSKLGHQQHLLSLWIALIIRTQALEYDASGLWYATRAADVSGSMDTLLVLLNCGVLANLLWLSLDKPLLLALFEVPLRKLGWYPQDGGNKVAQDPSSGATLNSDEERGGGASSSSASSRRPHQPQQRRRQSVVESIASTKKHRRAKLSEIDGYSSEKVGESSPRSLRRQRLLHTRKRNKTGSADGYDGSGGSDDDGESIVGHALQSFATGVDDAAAPSSVVFGPTFTKPFGDTDLLGDIQNYLGYIRARIAATYTLVMHEERSIREIREQGNMLQSDDEVSTDPDTDEETERTFVEKRVTMRSFLEKDSGILDEVVAEMVSEVCYEVEYGMADAFIVLPLMNIIHEVAVDALMEMTPKPEKLWAEMHAGSYELHDELYAEQMAIMAAQKAEEERLAVEERIRLEAAEKEAAALAAKEAAMAEEEEEFMKLAELETILYNKQKAKYDSEMEVRKRERKIARKIQKREEEAAARAIARREEKEAMKLAAELAEKERIANLPKIETPVEKKNRLALEKREKIEAKKKEELRKTAERKTKQEALAKEKEEKKKEQERIKKEKAATKEKDRLDSVAAKVRRQEEEKAKREEKKLLAEKKALRAKKLKEENRKRQQKGLKPIKSLSDLLPKPKPEPEPESESEEEAINKDTDDEGEATEPDDLKDEGVALELDEDELAAEMARSKAEIVRKARFREETEKKEQQIRQAELDRLAELERIEEKKLEEEALEAENQKRKHESRLETIQRLQDELEHERNVMAAAEKADKEAAAQQESSTPDGKKDGQKRQQQSSSSKSPEMKANSLRLRQLERHLARMEEENSAAEKKDIFKLVKFNAVRSHAAKMRERAAAAKAQREKDELSRRLKHIEIEKQKKESAMSQEEKDARAAREEKKARLKAKQKKAHEQRMALIQKEQEARLEVSRRKSMIANIGQEERVDKAKTLSVAEVEDRNMRLKEKEKLQKEMEAEQHRIQREAAMKLGQQNSSSKLKDRLRRRQSIKNGDVSGGESGSESEGGGGGGAGTPPMKEEDKALSELKRQQEVATQAREAEAKMAEEAGRNNTRRRIEIKKRKNKVRKKFGSVIGRVKLMYKMGAFDSVDEEEGEDDDGDDDGDGEEEEETETETEGESNNDAKKVRAAAAAAAGGGGGGASSSSGAESSEISASADESESEPEVTPPPKSRWGWGTITKKPPAATVEVSDSESEASISPRSPRFEVSDSEEDGTPGA
jgi:hypothetical protein